VVKTSPDELLDIASRLQTQHMFEIIAMLYPGVIHGRLTIPPRTALDILRLTQLRDDIENLIAGTGGDVQSRYVPRKPQSAEETAWLKMFTEELSRT
jgi:hypothetical protein